MFVRIIMFAKAKHGTNRSVRIHETCKFRNREIESPAAPAVNIIVKINRIPGARLTKT